MPYFGGPNRDDMIHEAVTLGIKPELVQALDALTDEQRVALLHCYCNRCGSAEYGCLCWYDC